MPHGDGIQRLLRDLAPQVLGAVARRDGDFGAAEDAVQEALLAAFAQWPREGVPDEPRAWLVRVASRRIADHVRAEAGRRRREAFVVSLVPPEDQLALAADEAGAPERDDTLDLLFLCCHPALSTASAIALTLRAVGGLTTGEIARAFLVPEATMAQRISRAKEGIRASGVPFAAPSAAPGDGDRPGRLGAVMHGLYLIFSEGYTVSAGPELQRADLSGEALRLARMLRHAVPDEPEVEGLLALMLLTDARRAARTGPAGELIPVDEQDRARWDRGAIAEGVALIGGALARGALGPHQAQAAVAALHDEAASAAETDWEQVLEWYGLLWRTSDNPMVALNEAIAAAMVHGPAEGLGRLDALAPDAQLAGHHRLHAARAPAGADGRPRGGGRGVSPRGGAHRERRGAGVPADARVPAGSGMRGRGTRREAQAVTPLSKPFPSASMRVLDIEPAR